MSEKDAKERELTITPQNDGKQQQVKQKNAEERDSEEPSEAVSYGREDRPLDSSLKNNDGDHAKSHRKSNAKSKIDVATEENAQQDSKSNAVRQDHPIVVPDAAIADNKNEEEE